MGPSWPISNLISMKLFIYHLYRKTKYSIPLQNWSGLPRPLPSKDLSDQMNDEKDS